MIPNELLYDIYLSIHNTPSWYFKMCDSNVLTEEQLNMMINYDTPNTQDDETYSSHVRNMNMNIFEFTEEIYKEESDWCDEKRLEYLLSLKSNIQSVICNILKHYSEQRDNGTKDEDRQFEFILSNIDKYKNRLKKMESEINFLNNKNDYKNSRLTPLEIQKAEQYPIEDIVHVNKSGFALCVNHSDRKPSMFCKNGFAYCFTCVKGSSSILTDKGLRQSKDIKIGDKILGKDGKFVSVLNISKYSKERKIRFYLHRKNNCFLDVTPEHKMMVCEGHKQPYKSSMTDNDYKKIIWDLKEKRANDVKVGDFMAIPGIKLFEKKYWDISVYFSRHNGIGKGPKSVLLNNEIVIDDDLLWFIGMYIAEGSSGMRQIVFTLHSKEVDYANRLIKIAKEKFNVQGNIFYRKDSNAISISFCNVYLLDVFKKSCGYLAENKHIPYELYGINNYSLIQGIYDGDGTKNWNAITSISKELISQLYHLYISFGVSPCYTFGDEYIDKSGIRHSKKYTLTWGEKKILNHARKVDNNLYLEVKSISCIYDEEDVYDFSVDGGLFVVDDILVHNCNFSANSIQLYRKIHNCSFVDAVKFLSNRN